MASFVDGFLDAIGGGTARGFTVDARRFRLVSAAARTHLARRRIMGGSASMPADFVHSLGAALRQSPVLVGLLAKTDYSKQTSNPSSSEALKKAVADRATHSAAALDVAKRAQPLVRALTRSFFEWQSHVTDADAAVKQRNDKVNHRYKKDLRIGNPLSSEVSEFIDAVCVFNKMTKAIKQALDDFNKRYGAMAAAPGDNANADAAKKAMIGVFNVMALPIGNFKCPGNAAAKPAHQESLIEQLDHLNDFLRTADDNDFIAAFETTHDTALELFQIRGSLIVDDLYDSIKKKLQTTQEETESQKESEKAAIKAAAIKADIKQRQADALVNREGGHEDDEDQSSEEGERLPSAPIQSLRDRTLRAIKDMGSAVRSAVTPEKRPVVDNSGERTPLLDQVQSHVYPALLESDNGQSLKKFNLALLDKAKRFDRSGSTQPTGKQQPYLKLNGDLMKAKNKDEKKPLLDPIPGGSPKKMARGGKACAGSPRPRSAPQSARCPSRSGPSRSKRPPK
jgi:hypothetical protein